MLALQFVDIDVFLFAANHALTHLNLVFILGHAYALFLEG
jgi:hypothetical protein